MARPLRIEYPGAYYHLTDRGVERRPIFTGDSDFVGFLDIVARLRPRYGIEVIAYCLIPNHYHLFVCTNRGKLHSFMQELNGRYGAYFNRKYERVGHLFQGRYHAILVQSDAYAMDVARYIHLNPVRARIVKAPADYRWSSYAQYLPKPAEGIVDTAFLLGLCGQDSGRARETLRSFTEVPDAQKLNPLRDAKGGLVLGDAEFRTWLRRSVFPRKRDRSASRLADLLGSPEATAASMRRRISGVTEDPVLARRLLVYALKTSTGLALMQVARLTGVKSPDAVGAAIRRLLLARTRDKILDSSMRKLESMLRKRP
jgi:REP element-mobilizing transposase RayT